MKKIAVLILMSALAWSLGAQPKADSVVWKGERPYQTIIRTESPCVSWKVIAFVDPGETCLAIAQDSLDPEYPVCDGTNGTLGIDCIASDQVVMHMFEDSENSPFAPDPCKTVGTDEVVHRDIIGTCANNDKALHFRTRFYTRDGAAQPTEMWVEKVLGRVIEHGLDESQTRNECRAGDYPGVLRNCGQKFLISDCELGLSPPWGSCYK